jgi:hypothetical protein
MTLSSPSTELNLIEVFTRNGTWDTLKIGKSPPKPWPSSPSISSSRKPEARGLDNLPSVLAHACGCGLRLNDQAAGFQIERQLRH